MSDRYNELIARQVDELEKDVDDLKRKLEECRAHADALAMHLGDYVYADGDPDKDEAIADLNAYRKHKEPGE